MMWVAGVYRLYTVHGDEKVRSDSKPDVKGALLEDLGDVSGRRPATGPTPFFSLCEPGPACTASTGSSPYALTAPLKSSLRSP